jgi:hypothetical protein
MIRTTLALAAAAMIFASNFADASEVASNFRYVDGVSTSPFGPIKVYDDAPFLKLKPVIDSAPSATGFGLRFHEELGDNNSPSSDADGALLASGRPHNYRPPVYRNGYRISRVVEA